MRMLHVGVGATSESNADIFFVELLGLAKAAPVKIAAELSLSIFALNRELTLIHYAGEGVDFEVFVDPLYRAPVKSVLHSCLEVDDAAGFLEKCADMCLMVNRVPRGDSFVTFISDLDGNHYEIKGKK